MRTYWSPAQAALEKSVLDNYEISCALLDQNSSLYSEGAQFAVPIRLVVDEEDAVRANHILNGNLEEAGEIEDAEGVDQARPTEATFADSANRNPWELLVLAFYLLLPAICLIGTKFPNNVRGRYGDYYVARAIIAHFLSWIALVAALVLIGFYFGVRRSAKKESSS